MTDHEIMRLYIDSWIHCNGSNKDCASCPVCRYPVGIENNLCEALTLAVNQLLLDMKKKYLSQ